MAAGRSWGRSGAHVYLLVVGILGLSTTVFGLGKPSQQATDSRLLFPYRSYRDVQIFHFRVPHQTSLATFHIKPNATARCPAKQLAVHLQFGGYPVVSPDKATFPPLLVVDRISEQSVHLPSDGETQMNVTAPLPGDWFAVAYLDEDTGQIVQKGIFRNCQVWVTITVKYYTEETIIDLVPSFKFLHNVTHQYNIFSHHYYRFFAPENSWSSQIRVTNCVQMVPGGEANCPIMLLARTRALPSIENNDAAQNCTDVNCDLTMVPAEDDWNYVKLQVLGTTQVKFDITVQIAACSQAAASPLEVADVPQLALAKLPKSMKQKKLKKSNSTRNGNQKERSLKARSLNSPLSSSTSSCWSRVPLLRNNLPGNFAYRFDSVPDENETVSMVLNLTTDSVKLLKFQIMPIVDSGGTLAVEMVLPPGLNTSAYNISVIGCLNYGVHPEVGSRECIKGWTINVNTSRPDYQANAIMIPYPETGYWYLSMQPSCYLMQPTATNESVAVETRCMSNETEIIFQIKSAPCILGRCGDYGNCYQYISGGFIFSTCVCQAGWRGYGCTDNQEALSNAELLLAVILLTLSNILFVPAIVLALYRRFFTEACVYLATMIFSTLYHACDCEVYSVCVLRLSVLQFCDFYSAILSVWVTLIAMAELPLSLQSLAHMMGAVGVALGVEYDRTGLWVFVAPASLALLIVVISWIRHCSRQHSCYPRRRLWVLCLLPGVLTAAAGLVLFTFLETKRNYQFVHSGWHAAMALSILFLLPERRHLKVRDFICVRKSVESEADVTV